MLVFMTKTLHYMMMPLSMDEIAHMDALSRRLNMPDSTAFSLCTDNQMPILVLKYVSGSLAVCSACCQGRSVSARCVHCDFAPKVDLRSVAYLPLKLFSTPLTLNLHNTRHGI